MGEKVAIIFPTITFARSWEAASQKKLDKEFEAAETMESNYTERVALNDGKILDDGKIQLNAEDKLEIISETVNRMSLITSFCILTGLTSVAMTALLA